MADHRKENWHLSKNVTVSTMMALGVLLLAQVYAYGQNQEKLDQVKSASTSHVVKSYLNQKMETQEYKIQRVADDIKEVKITIKENQKMMIELLQRTPKKAG